MGKRLKKYAKLLTAAWLLLCFCYETTANDQISISIGEHTRCENSEVLVPVFASDFLNIAALTLYIEIDTLKTEYLDVVNLHPEIAQGVLVSNFAKNRSQIIISWLRIVPVFISNDKLFDIQILYHQGDAALVFDDSCEVVFSNYDIADNVLYEDGLLIPVTIDIVKHPVPVLIDEGEQAQFSIELESEYSSLQYQWQFYNDLEWETVSDNEQFEGSTTNNLTINDVSYDLNNTVWRCIAFIDQCHEYSDPALLTVNKPTHVAEQTPDAFHVSVFPNPCSNRLYYEVNRSMPDFVLRLLDVKGETVYQEYDARQQGAINVEALEPGVYFLQTLAGKRIKQTVKVIKI